MSILGRFIVANQRILSQNPLSLRWTRTLFAEKVLGISEYESHRLRLKDMVVDPKRIRYELRSNDLEKLINSTKIWIHVMNKQNCQTEYSLLQKCLRHISQNAQSNTYNFGPTVMRMFHFLNMPDQAFKINFDIQLGEMFQQVSCTVILCDLLFNNGMYKEAMQVIQRKHEIQQRKGMSSSITQNYLLFATCYKLNDPEYFDYARDIWKNCVQEHQLTQSLNFLSMLAINQRHPQIALEILPPVDKHFSSINVRLMALSECGRFTEITQILENDVLQKNYRVSKEVIQRIRESLQKKYIS